MDLVERCRYNIPLVADIHFAPPVAMKVAECFDKIRINPGNFGEHIGIWLSIVCSLSMLFCARCSISNFTWYSGGFWSKQNGYIAKVFVIKCGLPIIET